MDSKFLDFTKLIMVDFHYSYIIDKYGNTVKHLFSDTDSLIYHIKKIFMKDCMMILIHLIFQHTPKHTQIVQETSEDTRMTINPLYIMLTFRQSLRKILILKYLLKSVYVNPKVGR